MNKLKVAGSAATITVAAATTGGILGTQDQEHTLSPEVKSYLEEWSKEKPPTEDSDNSEVVSITKLHGKEGAVAIIASSTENPGPGNIPGALNNHPRDDWKRIWGEDKTITKNPIATENQNSMDQPFWAGHSGGVTIYAVEKWIPDMVNWCIKFEKGQYKDPEGSSWNLEYATPKDLYKEICVGRKSTLNNEYKLGVGEIEKIKKWNYKRLKTNEKNK
ncbi:hypothetical protein MHSWG343_07460 [Candidatus Mycoplasma haematohominis]|uniref:Uncharacterized protein n=1 Tax=Candidatus Mycoplasma haematohominis TaxID=1494318 RepID=A0A478FTS3_9MOLU|nr:hypothetical protein MHSWG343_07460 [Candidatus Mycoplasma haemohominis]